jgi:hypothetical protein
MRRRWEAARVKVGIAAEVLTERKLCIIEPGEQEPIAGI